MKKIIENRIKDNKFVLIAEIGVNYYDIAMKEHISPIEAAKLMIREAALSGVHAVKFQSYKAETLAAKVSPYYWDIKEEPTDSQYKLFKKYDSFGLEEYKVLNEYSEEMGVEFLSTAFDLESADYLDPLMNVYKISSSDLNNLSFVEYQAKKNKPIILSVGASDEDEIIRTVNLIKQYNNKLLILMHCVLEYPTPYEHANLNKITSLSKKFPELVIGYSDHTKPSEGFEILKTAYNLGATVIEKHFTLDKSLKGNDHYHAMDPCDVKGIIKTIEFTNYIRGDGRLCCLESEKRARDNARRSLVAAMDIPAGTLIEDDMLTFKRPGSGIPADMYKNIIGKKSIMKIVKDTIIMPSMLNVEDSCLEIDVVRKVKDTVRISYKCSIQNVKFEDYANVAHHAQISNSIIGKRTSIGRYSKIRNAEIGKYCSISWDVTIGAVTHPFHHLSSHAFTYRKQFGLCEEDIDIPQKTTIIGNDVWIGCNSVIISGVKIGDGAVIGAGAVVTKDVEPYGIVVGVPAKLIKYRFNEKIRNRLVELCWWDWEDDRLTGNFNLFIEEVNSDLIEKLEITRKDI